MQDCVALSLFVIKSAFQFAMYVFLDHHIQKHNPFGIEQRGKFEIKGIIINPIHEVKKAFLRPLPDQKHIINVSVPHENVARILCESLV